MNIFEILDMLISDYFWQIFFIAINIYFAYWIYSNQHKLVFYPIKYNPFPSIDQIKHDFKLTCEFREIPIITHDNQTIYLYAFLQEHPSEHKTMFLFQSNAGSMLDRIEFIKRYMERCNVNFVIAVYRGFDKSTGNPIESKMSKDIKHYYDALSSLDIDMDNLILIGRSIGVSMALKMFNQYKIM